jgi:hypothetical protein
VVGGGAAGASAAIESASRGIGTVLLETQQIPFLTQRHATSRWIDPTQYDWPLDHYHNAQLPWSGLHRPLPLSFSAAPAPVLASRWHAELAHAAARLGSLLDLRFGRRLAGPPVQIAHPAGPFPESLGVTLDDGSTAVVGALVLAQGFGSENCRFERPPGNLVYEGQPFWGPDNFQRLTPGTHNVLISGSGDGALQDYLRVITHRPSAVSIVRHCNIPASVMAAVQSAEDRSLRGRSWASEDKAFRPAHEGRYFEELEAIHRDMVDRCLRHAFVLQGLRTLLPSRPVVTTLVYRERYIASYYGLNRFLSLLLSEHIRRHFNHTTLFPDTEVDSIVLPSPSSHLCVTGTPVAANGTYSTTGILLTHACFGQDHNVVLRSVSSGAISFSATYNVVVLRHGLQGPPTALTRPRHLPPYHKP